MWIPDILAPWSCAFCGTPSEGNEQGICSACFADLPWCEPPASPTPGMFVSLISMLQYEFPVDAAIKAMKFNRRLYYLPAFAEIFRAARPLLPGGIDAVLPVPLHWRRKTSRGFNQAAELSKPLTDLLNVPLLHGVRRARATPFQSGLDAAARAKNLRQAFSVRAPLQRKHVLVVDDVVTTGATLTQLATLLQQSGVEKVSALTLARAR